MQETWVQSLGQEDPLEEGMVTHSSIIAWRIPTEDPGGLQSMGSESDPTERLRTAHKHLMLKLEADLNAAWCWHLVKAGRR